MVSNAMNDLRELIKSTAFKKAMEDIYRLGKLSVDDFRELVDAYCSVDKFDGSHEEIVSLVEDITKAFRVNSLSFDEVILLLYRLSSSYIKVFLIE